MRWRFYLLGSLHIVQDDQPIDALPFRVHSLLAALLLRPQRRPRVYWAGLLFPDMPERKSRQRLSDLLYRLQQALPTLPLDSTREALHLPHTRRWLDVEAFGEAAGGKTLEAHQQALSLYRGELLAGYYDDWLLEDRESLRLQYLHLAHSVGESLLHQRRYEEALPLLERLLQEEAYDEKAVQMLMRTYRALGRRGAALRAYDQFVAVAAQELYIEPSPATRALAAEIRAATHVPLPPAPAPAHAQDPAAILHEAQAALVRGEWAAASSRLALLRRSAAADPAVLRLELDLALGQEDLPRAEQLLVAHGDPDQAQIQVRAAHLALLRYEWPAAREAAQQAFILAHEQDDPHGECQALTALAWALYQLGDIPQAMRSAEKAIDLARRHGGPAERVLALLVLARLFVVQRRDSAALEPLREALALAQERTLRPCLGRALSLEAWLQYDRGELLAAQETLQTTLALWRDLGIPSREVRVLTDLAEVSGQLGQHGESLRYLDQARDLLQRLGNPVKVAINQYNRAFALLYAKDAAAAPALALAREALATFRAHAQAGWEAATLMLLGYALLIAADAAAALPHLQQAAALYERLTEVEQLAEILAYQSLAYLDLGQIEPAQDYARRAVLLAAQGGAPLEAVPEIYYAYATVLSAAGEQKAEVYLRRAYAQMLAQAGQFLDEPARRAFFHRSPLTRRLMREVYDRGLASPTEAGVVSRRLPTASGTHTAPVAWTVDAGPADQALRQARGAIALRRARLQRLLREAQAQGLKPTLSDLALALDISPRTVQRDLRHLRSGEE